MRLEKIEQIKWLNEISENFDEEYIIADGFDKAIIGVWDGKVVYSRPKILEILSKDMSYEEAIEFFDFNIEGAYIGKNTPIYIEIFPGLKI